MIHWRFTKITPDLTPEDLAMIEYRLGLRQPAFINLRGSFGRVQAEEMTLYNLPATVEDVEISRTGTIEHGIEVAVIDEQRDGCCALGQSSSCRIAHNWLGRT